MSTRTASETLSEWAIELSLSDVPDHTIEVVRQHLLDTLGCGLAAQAVGAGTAALQIALADGQSGPATLLGTSATVPAAAAALANGMLCHGLDFDDTHEASIAHIGTVVGSAAIAAAQAVDADGAELLAAIVVGTEAVARIGMAAEGGGFHARGFHPTGVCGIFGATLAACRLRGAGVEETVRALGLAGSMGAGIFEYLADGSPTKPLHAGWAAHAGLMAAALAAAGAAGPRTVFEGRFGLFATHVDGDSDIGVQFRDLGDRWETARVALKPYPVCHWIHAPVDCAVAAAADAAPEEIERIVVRIPQSGVPIVLEPAQSKWRPQTAYDAKFALPWCVATRLVHGRLDVRTFVDGELAEPAVLALVDRIEAAPWTGPPGGSPFAGEADVTVAGVTRSVRLASPRGSGGTPLSDGEVRAKFRANAGLLIGESEVEAAIGAVEGLGANVPLTALAAAISAEAEAEADAEAGPNRRRFSAAARGADQV